MGMNLNALFNPVSLDADWWVPARAGWIGPSSSAPCAGGKQSRELQLSGHRRPDRPLRAGLLLLFRLWGNSTSRHVLLFSALSFIKRTFSAALRPLFNDFCSEQCHLCVQPCPSPRPAAAALALDFQRFPGKRPTVLGVYYLLFLSCIVLWIRLPAKRRGARLALIFLCLLQLVDLSPPFFKSTTS